MMVELLFSFSVLVREEKDLENEDTTFRPDMTHQLFGDQYVPFVSSTKLFYFL